VVSPILANIYLDKLDRFVEGVLCPAYNRGERRRINPPYLRLRSQRQRLKKRGHSEEARALFRQMQQLPSLDPADPDYRRLHYVRYADDTLLGFIGPKHEAEEIKRRLKEFLLQDLKLELSEEKTLITHAASQAARFLGYEIAVLNDDVKRDRRGYRSINGQIGLTVPHAVAQDACTRYLLHGKPVHRTELLHNAAYDIVVQYQAEYRGLVQYYQMAYNLHRFNRLKWVMEQSLTKTLAHKGRVSVDTVYERYRATLQTEFGTSPGLRIVVERGDGKKPLVATWGGIPLRRQMTAILTDQPPATYAGRSELVQRLLADHCELCGSRESVQVHHVRALKDLRKVGRPERPAWVRVMAARRRKTLVVCRECHAAIHAGRPTRRNSAE